MTWTPNRLKHKRIEEYGTTYDLPLFVPERQEKGDIFHNSTSNPPKNRSQSGVLPSALNLSNWVYCGVDVKALAYNQIQDRIGAARRKVLNAIFDLEQVTDRELASYLNWEINRITPRRKELQELGLIQMCGHKASDYGFKNTIWTIDKKGLFYFLNDN